MLFLKLIVSIMRITFLAVIHKKKPLCHTILTVYILLSLIILFCAKVRVPNVLDMLLCACVQFNKCDVLAAEINTISGVSQNQTFCYKQTHFIVTGQECYR